MLTQEQRAHYDAFGFVVTRGCFSPAEMAALTRDFEEVLAEDRRGEPFEGAKRQGTVRFIEKRPSLLRLMEDDRVYGAVEDLLGPGFVFLASEGNLMVGDTTWHPDGYRPNLHPDDWPLRLERIAATFYLDPVGCDTGCLRVIPGSHRPPLYHDLKRLLAYTDEPTYASLASLRDRREDAQSPAFGVPQRDVPCFPLESEPGDVIFWNANLWHASFGGRAGRRMCRVAFTRNPTEPEQIEYLRLYHHMAADSRKKIEPSWTGPYHEPAFLDSPRPRLRRLADRLVGLGLA